MTPRWLREQRRLRKQYERYPRRWVTGALGMTSQVTTGTNVYDWVTEQARMWRAAQ